MSCTWSGIPLACAGDPRVDIPGGCAAIAAVTVVASKDVVDGGGVGSGVNNTAGDGSNNPGLPEPGTAGTVLPPTLSHAATAVAAAVAMALAAPVREWKLCARDEQQDTPVERRRTGFSPQ